ncbi:MAG: hypothetical protein LLF76_14450 [Planctomycetaceae bacterium]|nr:hypothetical protein [Planctomycetaceae bacterium]
MKGLFLTDHPLPMKKYILIMACIAFVPSVLLSSLLYATGLFEQIGPDFESQSSHTPALAMAFGIAVISPIVETLIMSLFLFLLSLLIKSGVKLAIASAILWASLHSLLSPAWGLVVWWPFFVFSCGYLTWRKQSWLKAVWVTTCLHFLQNLLPSIMILAMA